MKKIVCFCVIFIILGVTGCHKTIVDSQSTETVAKKYYNLDDFKTIEIGESTYRDVYEIVPIDSITITSYGGICNYPIDETKSICIKFYGSELIVGEIKVVAK